MDVDVKKPWFPCFHLSVSLQIILLDLRGANVLARLLVLLAWKQARSQDFTSIISIAGTKSIYLAVRPSISGSWSIKNSRTAVK